MSGSEFDFNIDSILEEFSVYSESIGGETAKSEKPVPQEQPVNEEPAAPVESEPIPVRQPEPRFEAAKPRAESRTHQENHSRQRSKANSQPEEDPFYSLKSKVESSRAARRDIPSPAKAERPTLQEPRRSSPADKYRREEKSAPKAHKTTHREEKHTLAAKPAAEAEKPARQAEPVKALSPLTPLLGLICSVLIILGIVWVSFNVHPGTSSGFSEAASQKLDLVNQLDVYLNNMASDAMGDLAYIRKVYKIDENATFAPAPDPGKYGTVDIADAEKILDVIQQARDSGLLEEQEMVFDPDANFYHISDIQYYCDDTILVICWKEQIDGKVCSFVEVKIADASQFRRKITEDTYGSSVKQYASQLSASANAVVAMNADFYAFRSLGMVVYQRELYRFNTGNAAGFKSYNCIDHCFIDGKGDLLIMRRGEEFTKESMEQYIKDNDILFGLAFGPVLVENGEIQPCNSYPAGEINSEYSRAGLGQMDSLHYLYMTVNWSDENTPRATVKEFANIFHSKGVQTAYCLDGGQTSEIVMNDVPFNRIDFNAERTVSDIIYFATAIPESEVTK